MTPLIVPASAWPAGRCAPLGLAIEVLRAGVLTAPPKKVISKPEKGKEARGAKFGLRVSDHTIGVIEQILRSGMMLLTKGEEPEPLTADQVGSRAAVARNTATYALRVLELEGKAESRELSKGRGCQSAKIGWVWRDAA